MARNLILTWVASGLILSACGGGGGDDSGTADTGGTSTGATTPGPGTVPTLGDPAGFPVATAFANVRKQGFFETSTLKQQGGFYLDVFLKYTQSIPVTMAGGITATASTSVMAGAANVLGQYNFAAIYTIAHHLVFDARFNVTYFLTYVFSPPVLTTSSSW